MLTGIHNDLVFTKNSSYLGTDSTVTYGLFKCVGKHTSLNRSIATIACDYHVKFTERMNRS